MITILLVAIVLVMLFGKEKMLGCLGFIVGFILLVAMMGG